jgi:hypothetical protein
MGPDEHEGLSDFALEDGVIYHTYSCHVRGLDEFNVTHQLLDRVPRGRDEDKLPHPRLGPSQGAPLACNELEPQASRKRSLLSKAVAMNAPDTYFDLEAADEILMSPRSAGAKRMPQVSRGSATMIATQREIADGSAGSDNAAALGAADWVCLAAAPTFAIMALLTGVLGGGPPDFCSAAHDASPLSGMVPMYMLMSAFHSAPWLKLISSRRSGAYRS